MKNGHESHGSQVAAAAAAGRARGTAREAGRLVHPRRAPTAPVAAKPAAGLHTISLASGYGQVLATEQVAGDDFAAGLWRFYRRAMQRPGAVIVVDGVLHTRNSFLEFVRQFDECVERAQRLGSCASGVAPGPPRIPASSRT